MRVSYLVLLLYAFVISFLSITEAADGECVTNLLNDEAPVVIPLKEALGDDIVLVLRLLIRHSVVGRVMVPPEAQTCIANMDGTKLANTLTSSAALFPCPALANISRLSFVQQAVEVAVLPEGYVTLDDFFKLLASVKAEEIEEFCILLENGVVPCLHQVLLPALAVIREKHASGCCDGWLSQIARDFDYTISAYLTKVTQVVGNVMCATQEVNERKQRCGYTLIQSITHGSTGKDAISRIKQSLQIPVSSACEASEGLPYKDTQGKQVARSESAISGCAAPLDQAIQWVRGLPISSSAVGGISHSKMFDGGQCLAGPGFMSLSGHLVPHVMRPALGSSLKDACVHLPSSFSHSCKHSRPVTQISWPFEPQRLHQASEFKIGLETNIPTPHQSANEATGSRIWSLAYFVPTALCMLTVAAQ